MVVRRLIFMAALILAGQRRPERVAEIGTDWTGNDMAIEAIADLKVKGTTVTKAI